MDITYEKLINILTELPDCHSEKKKLVCCSYNTDKTLHGDFTKLTWMSLDTSKFIY